jgi:PAS domain S-box-containing protein
MVRTLRLMALIAAIGLVPLAVGMVVVRRASAEHARADVDHVLTTESRDRAAALDNYFERARSVILLTAHNPAFAAFYDLPGNRAERVRNGGAVVRDVELALAYLERLYPESIGEACFIDRSGWENARVVRGERAAFAELGNEVANPFYAPTFALGPGEVYQAEPYRSPDTGEWVISNSTIVPTSDGIKHATVHFEVTIESFRRAASAAESRVYVVDAKTGVVVLDSRHPQRLKAVLGRPDIQRFSALVGRTGHGVLTLADQRLAYHRLPARPNNANDWIVVVESKPAAAATGFGPLPLAILALGLVLIGFGVARRWIRLSSDLDNRADARYRTLAEQLPLAVYVDEPDHRDGDFWQTAYTSPQIEGLLGLTPEEFKASSFIDLIHPDDAEQVTALHERAYETLTGLDNEYRLVRRDGSTVWVRDVMSFVHDASGDVAFAQGYLLDVSDRKTNEEKLDRLLARERGQNEELRELDRLKDEFVALVSHELRTPLTSIRGYLELVLDGEPENLSDEQRQFLGVVERNSERLQRLVGDLLFVAQVDAGRLALELGHLDAAEVGAEAVEAAKPAADQKGLELRLAGDPKAELIGDRARLSQLVDNLVSNAIKFTPNGGRVEVSVRSDGTNVSIEISDSGMGISVEEQDRLFQRFFRTAAATTQAIPGTGLGLAISKAIVDAHEGTIEVESVEGRGTTFRVTIPAHVNLLEQAA